MVFVTHWPKNIGKKFPAEIKLDRVLEVCSRLENPHLKIPPVIHVSGTNGKGSVVSYITNILINAGFKVHKYISPHLIEFNERIILNGNNIDDEYLFDIIERTRRAAELRPVISGPNSGLTLFEATTIASFIAFSEVKADFLVMEVGMGGRVDPTNIVENKILSIITPVAIYNKYFIF
jgi:dihydrofolate synthase/folylpolyglutamate synthase